MKRRISYSLVSLAVAATVAMTSGPVWAQNGDNEFIEEIITTGTRKEGTSPTEAMSPVDVLSGDAFVEQASFDLTDSITRLSPSLNTQRYPIADGTAFVAGICATHALGI